jgi:uncharacterized membrane protein HdeD (DUF308 family)
MTTIDSPTAMPLVRTLRNLYFARFLFAIVWAGLLALAAPTGGPLLTVLLIVYPLADAVAVFIELRGSETTSRSRVTETANIVISVLAAIALGWASTVSLGAVLAAWGAWAVLAGAAQLLTGVTRRHLGGQWPLIISGGISVLAGSAFLAQGIQGGTSVASVAGYATLGGVLFLVSAIRLIRTARTS